MTTENKKFLITVEINGVVVNNLDEVRAHFWALHKESKVSGDKRELCKFAEEIASQAKENLNVVFWKYTKYVLSLVSENLKIEILTKVWSDFNEVYYAEGSFKSAGSSNIAFQRSQELYEIFGRLKKLES